MSLPANSRRRLEKSKKRREKGKNEPKPLRNSKTPEKEKRKGSKFNRKNEALAKSQGFSTSEFVSDITPSVLDRAVQVRDEPIVDPYDRFDEVFEDLFSIVELEERFKELEEAYDVASSKDEDSLETQGIKREFQDLWEEHFEAPFPDEFSEAIFDYNDHLDKDEALERVKLVTNLPGLPKNDVLDLNARDFDQLERTLKSKGLPVSLTGIKRHLRQLVNEIISVRKRLGDEQQVVRSLWNGNFNLLRITYTPLQADAHGFLGPLKMRLTDGSTTKDLIYKSRPGEVDKMVTDLFKEINKHLVGEKLPVYEQAVFSNQHLLSEFIDGDLLADKIELFSGVGNNLDTLQPDSVPLRQELGRRIHLLSTIAAAINLTDLHEENLIYDPVNNRVVPIDLESFAIAPQVTGLYGDEDDDPDPVDLPPAVGELIQQFKAQLKVVARRLVPVATGILQNAMNDLSINEVVGLIKEGLEKNELIVDEDSLREYVTAAKQSVPVIVPSFTIKNGVVSSAPLNNRIYQVAEIDE